MAKIKIIAEGDSWFDIPDTFLYGRTTDVLARFMDITNRYRLVRQGQHAHMGDTITEMVNREEEGERLAHDFEKAAKFRPIQAMLFSGGGNDLLAKLPAILNQKDPQKPYFKKTPFKTVTREIKDGYQYFIDFCEDRNAKLISHTYYSPDPAHRALGGVDLRLILKGKGYTNPKDQAEICRQLIEDHFVQLLSKLKEKNPLVFDYVEVHKLRLTKNDRLDQIHLSFGGCKKVAHAFVKKLDEQKLVPPAKVTKPSVSPTRSGPTVGGR